MISWMPEVTSSLISVNDRVVADLYFPKYDAHIHTVGKHRREEGNLILKHLDSYIGPECHVYLFFCSEDGNSSATQYLGIII